MRRKILFAALLVIVVLLLTACGGPEDTYKSANNLLAKGKYAEAAEKFASLGSYEDAAYLTIYADACAKGESQDRQTIMEAIFTFESLSGYKDSNMRTVYYYGRIFEANTSDEDYETLEEAITYYEQIPLFLDSSKRIANLKTRIENGKTSLYNAAVNVGDSGDYEAALSTFERLGEYKDSKNRLTYYAIRKDEDTLAASTNQDALLSVGNQYANMGEYLDCAARVTTLIAKADEIVTNKYANVTALIGEGKYAEAKAILDAFGQYGNEQVTANYYAIAEGYLAANQWDEAHIAFCKASNYSDASSRIYEPYYKKAESLLAEDKWDEASAAFTRASNYRDASSRIFEPYYKQGETLLAEGKWDEASAAFKKAGDYSDAKDRILEPYYKQGETLLAAGDEGGAIAAFKKADNYNNAQERWQTIYFNGDPSSLAFKYTNNYITFGQFEQDGNQQNGKEDIEWLVLAKENNRLLLVSRYALACKPYNQENIDTTWETCTLRNWLNQDFYEEAFSPAEKAIIPVVTVSADENLTYNTHSGDDTQDKVFLLGNEEVRRYFSSVDSLLCTPTVYAKRKGVYTDSDGFCWWLLRAPGNEPNRVAYVRGGEGIEWQGDSVRNSNKGIRPALWINLEP